MEHQKAFDLIKQAKTRLMLHYPFWAYFLCRREIELDTTVKTAQTDGKTIRFNPDFALTMPLSEVAFVLAHEVAHIALGHVQRTPSRVLTDRALWSKYQIAADLSVNSILNETIKQGRSMITLPDKAQMPAKYGLPESLSMEEYVRLLPDQDGDGDGNGDGNAPDPGGCGAFAPQPSQGGSEPQQGQGQQGSAKPNDIDQSLKEELAGAMQAAKMAGKMPAGMDRYIDKAIESRIYYPEVLAAFLKESAGRSDYSWARPNPRYMNRRIYVPSLSKTKDSVTLGIIIDTSGSIDDIALKKFAGELNAIKGELKADMHVIYVDTNAAGGQYFSDEEDVDLKAKGGGGTDFRPGFVWMDENTEDIDAVVYLTDGHCDSFPRKDDVSVPTLWCIEPDGVKNFNPPFGDVLYI